MTPEAQKLLKELSQGTGLIGKIKARNPQTNNPDWLVYVVGVEEGVHYGKPYADAFDELVVFNCIRPSGKGELYEIT